MLTVVCPHCGEAYGILFGGEIGQLLKEGKAVCTCSYCKRIFEIYQGKEKYEVRKINIVK